MLKRNKDKTYLVARYRLPTVKRKPHYIFLYIWQTREAMQRNVPPKIDGEPNYARAYSLHNVIYVDAQTGAFRIPRLLGELHYVVNDWGEEIASHEVAHMMLHYIRCFFPDIKNFIDQNDMEEEEEACYQLGKWVSKVYRRLWTHLEEFRAKERKERDAGRSGSSGEGGEGTQSVSEGENAKVA